MYLATELFQWSDETETIWREVKQRVELVASWPLSTPRSFLLLGYSDGGYCARQL